MVVQMRNQQLYLVESALDLVCIWDREKDACQEEGDKYQNLSSTKRLCSLQI